MATVYRFMSRSPLAVDSEDREEAKAIVRWLKCRITPEEAHKRLGVGLSTVHQWYSGHICPGKAAFPKIKKLKQELECLTS